MKHHDANDILRAHGPDELRKRLDGAPDQAIEQLPKAIPGPKPDLLVDRSSDPETARNLRDLFARSGRIFDRDGPVCVASSANGAPFIYRLAPTNVVYEADRVCQPMDPNGRKITLPMPVANLYLAMIGEWQLRPLTGVTTSPLLSGDGSIHVHKGYDERTQLWCHCITTVDQLVPAFPTLGQAQGTLQLLRSAFKTFCFADARRVYDTDLGVEVVDPNSQPGVDESAFLVRLLTALCRASIFLSPGLLVSAPAFSGAGCGKGLLIRAICAAVFGIQPHAFTQGHDNSELEKRIATELIEGAPVLFLDNANGLVLNSATLASSMTERPAHIRVFGELRNREINSATFVAATGNALRPSGDMARRFFNCELDARMEDPETRPFRPGFVEWIAVHREELLAAALTIWRWGRQNAPTLMPGKPLGSFEHWAEWCRDPLLALGCLDPVERIAEAKARDPRRQQTIAIFQEWKDRHPSDSVTIRDLAESVVRLIDPHNRGRQFVQAEVGKLVGTRIASMTLSSHRGSGRNSVTTYRLEQTDPS